MEKITNFYLKNSVLVITSILAILGWISWTVTLITTGQENLLSYAIIFLLLTCGMLLAYFEGEINVQKMLFGALFIYFIRDYIDIYTFFSGFGNRPITIHSLCSIVLICIIFICHLAQQMDHYGNTKTPIINQFCGIMAVFEPIFIILTVSAGVFTINDISYIFAVDATLFMIICMETRIHKYKQIRTKAKREGTWNEENRAEAKKIFKI